MSGEGAGRTRAVAHASGHGAWRMEFLAASARLAPFVRRFNAYAEHGTGFARRREPPSGLATLVFNLGPELRVEHPRGVRTTYPGGAGFFAGLHHTHALTETDGAQEGVQVMLTPLGARRLLGLPLGEIGGRLVAPGDLFGAAADALVERLHEANTHSRRLAILERFVEQRLADAGPVPRDLAWALQRVQDRAGRVGVGALAEELGCSRKHLAVRFRREFGMAPKLLARVLRFDHAARLLKSGRAGGLAALADACGYADQAHLTREFRAFAGSPPTTFLRRLLPDEGGVVD